MSFKLAIAASKKSIQPPKKIFSNIAEWDKVGKCPQKFQIKSTVTYVKLQDAYVAETGAYYGNFNKIGYEMPGKAGKTSNFQYAETGTYSDEGTASFSSSNVDVWSATNLLKLNDCVGSLENWKLGLSQADGQTNGQYTWKVTMGANCDALTPSFKSFDNSKDN